MIEHSTVIALAEYQAAVDGSMRPIITDILKKAEGLVFYYDVATNTQEAPVIRETEFLTVKV